MRRLLTFLIISILFSQSAWAFHDVEFNPLQDHTYTQMSDQNDANSDYDHCGHASSHLVGLISHITMDIYTAPGENLTILTNITSSISYQPPVPPPTV